MSSWTPTFTGVPMGQTGPVFDICIGYFDPVANAVNMIGYVIPPSGNSQEGTDVTDDSHLVQISSPNSTDRFARFPQASQGDWSKGERQRVFIDASSYYESDGSVDTSTPGNLVAIPSLHQDTYTLNGTYNLSPIATDGEQVFIGLKTGSTNLAISSTGTTPGLYAECNNHEIFDFVYTPFGLVAMTDQGLWVVDGLPSPSSSQIVTETLSLGYIANRSLAYLDDNVYYINNDHSPATLETYNYTTNTGSVVVLTTTKSEAYFQCVCNTSSGLFFATTSTLPFQNFFYTWSGSTADPIQRIYEVQGRVEYALEALGTVYVLVRQFQKTYRTNPAWTLYAVVGSQVTLIDDARFISDPNFAPTCTSVLTFDAQSSPTHQDFKPSLTSDGRFLYIAWPGLPSKRIDLVNGGISQLGGNWSSGQANVIARRFISFDNGPYVDVATYGTTTVLSQYSQAPTTGALITSFFDFDSPGTGKIFRSVEFQMSVAPVGTQAIAFAYRLDQTSSFTSLTTQQIGPRNFSAAFPSDIKGTEVQLQVTLTSDASAGSPTLTSYSVIADLGRVVNITVSCRRNQQSRNEMGTVDAGPYNAQQLQANLLNIRNIGGGRCYLYIVDPTQSQGVSQIQARLLDYQRTTPSGFGPGFRPGEDGTFDLECDVALQFVESFDP